jgi:hypothetical protein
VRAVAHATALAGCALGAGARAAAQARAPSPSRSLNERVAAALGASVVEVMPALMRLELRGLVRSVGGRFERTLRA